MIRSALVIVAGLMLAALPAFAQGASPESEDSRYTFNRADDGYLRLDGRTGQVSLCTRRPVGWACQAVPDERTALEAEIARLQGENAALKKAMLDRGLPLPGGVLSDAPDARGGDTNLKLPNNADIDRMMTAVEKVWRRLVEMLISLQKDIMKKT